MAAWACAMIAHPRRVIKDVNIMNELNKQKNKYSFDLYRGNGIGPFPRKIPIEWDVLAAVSNDCLVGPRGFVEREIVMTTPASVIWRLWNCELGEMGTFEVRKTGAELSQITFSGLDFQALLSDEEWEIKRRHMRDIINAFYFHLSNMFSSEEWQPWMHIPDKDQDRKIIQLWCEHTRVKDIAREVYLMPGVIYNKICWLRKTYPKAKIPRKHK
jgi:hypothetical protein